MNRADHNGAPQQFSRIPLLMFSNLTVRGGAEEHMLMLLRHLNRDYFRLHVAFGPEVADSMQSDLPSDVELSVLKFTRLGDLAGAFEFRRLLQRQCIGILHSHMFWSSFFGSPVGRLVGVPVIIETPHVREQWRRGWKASYRIDRVVARCVHHYIAVSHANARYLFEEKRIPPEKVNVIQNGCELSRFSPVYRPPTGMKAALGFAAEDPVLLVVARLHEQKGHRVLLDALTAILERVPNAKLVCAGDGPLRSTLESQITSLGLTNSVRMVGHQLNVADWLALADVVVLPSFYEGLPLVAIEAMAAGKPVVATAVDGTPEVVIDGETGLLIPPGNSRELALAICRLLLDPLLRRTLSVAGYDYVRKNFTHERQVQLTEQLYLRAWKAATGRSLPMTEPEREEVSVEAQPLKG
jgi:glycosyltransferase involved in cell wall biosynthesis